jgi:hypothetical protein
MAFALPAAASAISAAAPAAAAPAAAATAAKATLMTTLKSVAFNALTNLAISAALSAFQPQVGQSGRTFEFVIDPDGPIPFAAGRVGVAGSVIHRDTFGPDLMYYGIPFVLSGAGPIDGIESFKADDYPMLFDANGGATTEPYRQELFFRSVLGHQPAPVALSTPSGLKNGATLPGWTAAHKLSGKAAGLIVMAENSKGSAFPTGEIKPLITFRGLKVYDPRLDSTYPGGSGSHRLNNAATWTYSANPILWALKWTLGLWEGPTGKGAPQVDYQVGGIGAKLSGIDVPAFVAAANVADANGWTVSAYPNTDDDKHQVLETFLQAGGAIYSQRAGKISCIQRAAPRTSIVTISAADTAGPLEIDTAASRINRINTLRPRFWSPAHRWQMTALDGEVTATTYREQDGAVRSRGIDYPYVSDARQAAQLAALQIAHTREGIAGVIPLKPHLQRIRPGDAFTITEPGFVLNGLKCLCLNTDYDPATGVVRVSFVSETDAKYPFALGQDPTPPEPQVLEPVDPRYVTPPLPGDWTVTPRPPAPGGQLPGFDLGGVVSNDTATSIIVEHGPTDEGPWKQAYEGPPTVTNIPIDGLQPGAIYYIAIQYRRDNNYSARHVYGPYEAPALIGDVDPNAPGLSDIKADIAAAFGDISDVSDELADARADLEAADAALGSAIGSLDNRADTLESQTASLETNKASVSSLNAQVARIDGVEAVNATQALALVDLANGKVALSEYNTLKGEVTAARDGAPSLLGQIQNLKTVDLDLQNNKASVASVNALTARTANTEADIIDLENALATETGARAQAIQQVTARQNINPNLFPGGSGELGVGGWGGSGGLLVGNYPNVGPSYFFKPFPAGVAVDDYQVSPRFKVEGIPVITAQWTGFAYLGATTEVWVAWYDAGGAYVSETPHVSLASGSPQTFTRPSTAIFAEWVLRTYGPAPTGYADVVFHQIKFERGSVATIYSNDASQKAISASVTEHSLAIIDLELQQALASYQLIAAATGGKPARFALVSSTAGSYVAIDAPYIFWGDNTVFDDASDTLQTVIGSNIRVLALGAPFGAGGKLLEWWGPSSVALGTMSSTNGFNGRIIEPPYVFDTVTANQAPRVASVPIDGRIGYNQALNTAALTAALAVPAFGKFVLSVQLFSTSDNDGSVISATGTASLKRLNGASETTLVSGVNVSGQTVDPAAKNTSALNVTVANSFAGNVTFRLDVQGGGGPSTSHGTVQGTLTVTWYPI